jgi:hypothetical protein
MKLNTHYHIKRHSVVIQLSSFRGHNCDSLLIAIYYCMNNINILSN